MSTSVAPGETGAIQKEIASVEAHLARLKAQLKRTKNEARRMRQQVRPALESDNLADCSHGTIDAYQIEILEQIPPTQSTLHHQATNATGDHAWPLKATEYVRYGRQMILPEIGFGDQLRLKDAKVLVIGIGGLGCPAAAYVTGAGDGTMGLMDGDVVETSDLHWQIAHTSATCGD